VSIVYWWKLYNNDSNPSLSSVMTYHQVSNKINSKGATSGTGTAYRSGTTEFTPGFSGVHVAQSLVFCVVFCRSLFVLLSFLSWHIVLFVLLRLTVSDYSVGILDLLFLITQLVSKIYCFWLLSWDLRFTVSDYSVGILDLLFLITQLVS
jgi:uncharacterized membrane protein